MADGRPTYGGLRQFCSREQQSCDIISLARDRRMGSEAGKGGTVAKAADVGPLAANVRYLLRRAQLAVFDELIQALAPLGLRPAQYGVLILLKHAPGLKQTDVAGALGIQRANF